MVPVTSTVQMMIKRAVTIVIIFPFGARQVAGNPHLGTVRRQECVLLEMTGLVCIWGVSQPWWKLLRDPVRSM